MYHMVPRGDLQPDLVTKSATESLMGGYLQQFGRITRLPLMIGGMLIHNLCHFYSVNTGCRVDS